MKFLKKITPLLVVIACVFVITIIWKVFDISKLIEELALWAFPLDQSRNGLVLQIGLNILAGLAILFGLYVSYRRAKAMELSVEKQGIALQHQNIQIELTRKSQTDERFKNAIEHLGSDKEPIILGGVTELHQIALENKELYAEVVLNILCSYIRSTSNIKRSPKEINKTINQTIINYLFKTHKDENYPYKNLHPNLEFSNLSMSNMDDIKLSGANLSFCYLPSLEKSIFIDTNFGQSKFFLSQISEVNFLDCEMHNAHFKASTLDNVGFYNVNKKLTKLNAIDTLLVNVRFDSVGLQDNVFISCEFEKCTFNNSNILDSTFSGSSFNKITFNQKLFSHCDFRAASFHEVIIKDILMKSKFQGCSDDKQGSRYMLSERLANRINKKANLSGIDYESSTFFKCYMEELTQSNCVEIKKMYDEIDDQFSSFKNKPRH